MADRIERNTQTLLRVGCGISLARDVAELLASAGLTLARIEPDEATVEEVARAIESFGMDVAEIVEEDEPDRATDIRDEIFAKARAACRAAVGEG